uniref:Uncharacterized protein n=1 Tax=Opuntia streptacantha TaxID=393608 RepID=A0A7C8YGF1_OPUST
MPMGTRFVKLTNTGTWFSTQEPWALTIRVRASMVELQLLVGMTRPWVPDMGPMEPGLMSTVAVATTRVPVLVVGIYSKRSKRVVSLAFSTAPEAPALVLRRRMMDKEGGERRRG